MRRVVTIAAGLLGLALTCGCIDSDPEAPERLTAAADGALSREDRIAVQANIAGEWVTLHPRADGLGKLFRITCDAEVQSDPAIECPMLAQDVPLNYYSGTISDTNACKAAVCSMRSAICVGQFLEEMAKSPVPRETSISLTEAVIAALDLPPGEALLSTGTPYQFRFGPALGASRPAALRVSLGVYSSAVETASLANSSTVTPTATCAVWLQTASVTNPETQRAWGDVFGGAFIDAASRMTELVRTLGAETRSATMTKALGYKTPSEQSVKRWNEGTNSFVGLGRAMGTGRLAPKDNFNALPPSAYTGGSTFNRVYNVDQLPACPPVEGNLGVHRAIGLARATGVSVLNPKERDSNGVTGPAPFTDALISAYIEDKAARGELSAPPTNPDEVLSRLGFSRADAELAGEYLRTEAAMFGRTHVELPEADQPAPPASFKHVPRSFGTHEPEADLPKGVITTQMLGAMDDSWYGSAPEPDSPSSLKSGVVRALDHTRWLAHALSQSYASTPLAPALAELERVLASDVGSSRVLINVDGQNSEGDRVDNVSVVVYGASAGAEYLVVQGLPELKCLLSGTVDGAPCEADAVAVKLTGATSSLYPDLSPDAAMGEFSQLPQLDLSSPSGQAPLAQIRTGETVYVIELQDGGLRVMGGMNADVDPSMAFKSNSFAAGGLIQQEIEHWLGAHGKDCSQPANSCVGLSARLVPPLESEIVGSPTGQPFEAGWKYYLESARTMADEADRMGEELLASGLDIDRAMNDAEQKKMDLCGADGRGCAELVESYVVLGSEQKCLWLHENSICQQFDQTARSCPFSRSTAELSTCESTLGAVPADVHVKDVIPLSVVQAPKGGGGGGSGDIESCAGFNTLRRTDLTPRQREDIIKGLAATWTPERVAGIAKGIHYVEHFGDNYELTYGGPTNVVFDTRRRSVRSPAAEAKPPCNAALALSPDDSAFWGTTIGCFASDFPCDAVAGTGKDGCLDALPSNERSLDTESGALRRRWAWGFGHLRRAVTTLGLITGKLDGMMSLAFVVPHRYIGSGSSVQDPELGSCGFLGNSDFEDDPTWIWRCDSTPGDQTAKTICILPADPMGVNGDPTRSKAGRPVNFNGFLGNWLWSSNLHESYQSGDPDFPSVCVEEAGDGCSGWASGGDPQMVYCGIPANFAATPTAWTGDFLPLGGSWQHEGSAWIGASHHADLNVDESNMAWAQSVPILWSGPGNLNCGAPGPGKEGAIWSALCHAPGQQGLAALIGNSEFMRYGHVPDDGAAMVNAEETGSWLGPIPYDTVSLRVANSLYDVRQKPIWASISGTPGVPLQYALTPRNILDAMELACHVNRSVFRQQVSCPDVLASDPVADDLAGYLECLATSYQEVGAEFVAGPVPQPVIDAFVNRTPISPTTGLGGEYLDGMVDQRDALEGIGTQFDALSDAIQRQASFQYQFELERERFKKWLGAEKLHVIAQQARDIASGLERAAGATNGVAALTSGGTENMALAWSSALSFVAAAADLAAATFEVAAAELSSEAELARILEGMRDNARATRDSSRLLLIELDNLTRAAAAVRLTKAKADRNEAMGDLADYWDCGDEVCPIPYNTAMRRTYNTRLLRYEHALWRAKQAAFVARRAIEVRFGVDLPRMTRDMSFVEPPSTWADSLCEMQGINYAEIRTADAGVEPIDFNTPSPGDDFADAFIGDYVGKLEDFVRSYPFDYPLKESDDTAVLSLKDDILGLTGMCAERSYNLLRYSTMLSEPSAWEVVACDAALTTPGNEVWTGCVQALPRPDADDDGTIGAAPVGGELPEGAEINLLRNAACVAVDAGIPEGAAKECPDQEEYYAKGALSQAFTTESYGNHWASAYFRTVSETATGQPVLRVIDPAIADPATAEVAETLCSVGVAWTRCTLLFSAQQGKTYHLEILPSSNPSVALSPGAPATWPSVMVAAVQVEAATLRSDNVPEPPRDFQVTDQTRLAPGHACIETTGFDLRKKFDRICEKGCSEGIKPACSDPDEDATASEMCFYEVSFDLPIEAVEGGRLLQASQIAAGNFNYRHNTIALNLVGSGVVDCGTKPTQSCYASAFAEFTLLHATTGVTNWEGSTLDVAMPLGRIEHGKALAAERMITNPPSSTDTQLLEPYTKSEFRGRPLHGRYRLRVWESPELAWNRVDDIQLVWRYHYWTRFDR